MMRNSARAQEGSRRRPPALVLVASSAVSVQFGAALATHLFPRVGASGAVTLRLVIAALLLGAVLRPRHLTAAKADFGVALTFGLTMAAMNLSFYEAISRIPLGVAVTVEFAGPLTVSLVGSRRAIDLLWALLAAGGVVLLAGGSGHHLDLAGIGLALAAGVCWAGYILLSRETGRRFPGPEGLALAMLVAAAGVLPLGIATAGAAMLAPGVLGAGAAVALLSSAVPYSLELIALRRVTPRAFGILASLDPAMAALAGLVVLGQDLTWIEIVALLLVMAANAGNAAVSERGPAAPPGILPD